MNKIKSWKCQILLILFAPAIASSNMDNEDKGEREREKSKCGLKKQTKRTWSTELRLGKKSKRASARKR